MGQITRLTHVLTTALAVLLFAHSAAHSEPSTRLPLPEPLKKEPLPHFSVRDRDAQNLLQKRHIERTIQPHTKRIAFVFFATWCMPCAEGATILKNARAELAKNGVETILVNVGENDVRAIHKWIGQYGDPSATLLLDNRSQMAGAFGLLEKNGTIVMPKILVLDAKFKPLFLLGTEGSDFPRVLWEYNP